MSTRLAVAACIALAITGAARGASAHLGHTIARGERYLKFDATSEDTRLVVSLTLGPDEGLRVQREADTDGDGQVSPRESAALLTRWGEGLRTELPVELDGDPADVVWTDGWLDPLGPVGRRAVTVELVAHLPLEAREHEIAWRDAMVRREVFDRTDVAFRAREGATLLACGAGALVDGCTEDDLALPRGEASPTRFVARVRFADRWMSAPVARWIGPRARREHAPYVGLAALAAVGIATAVAVRRRRRVR